jgi:hypothetical protein
VLFQLRHHIAVLLLLVFGRVMVPDAAWLALHPHEHTEHEAAHAPDSALKGQTVVAEKHTHCATDHLFSAPTLPAPTFAWGVVVPPMYERPTGVSLSSVWTARLVQTLCLRGPPADAHAGRRTA